MIGRYTAPMASALFVRQLKAGWNEHLDADHRLLEAFNHGFNLARVRIDDPVQDDD